MKSTIAGCTQSRLSAPEPGNGNSRARCAARDGSPGPSGATPTPRGGEAAVRATLGLPGRVGVVRLRGREHQGQVLGRGIDLVGAHQALDEHPAVLAPGGDRRLRRQGRAHDPTGPSSRGSLSAEPGTRVDAAADSGFVNTWSALLRLVARSSVPRYDATTSGSLRIVVGRALGDDCARPPCSTRGRRSP